MIFIWGFRLFGRVDEVPGIFHVASKFFHVWYIPLIPIGSHLVIGRSKAGAIGVRVPFSLKSVILAWLRAACIAGAIFFAVLAAFGFTQLNEPYVHHRRQFAVAAPASAPTPQSGSPNSVGVPTSSPAPGPSAPAPSSAPTADPVLRAIVASALLCIGALFAGAAAVLWKLRWLRHASYERAMALCEHAKLSDEARIKIERRFGKISEAEAQAALAAAAADRAELSSLADEVAPA